jgi:hypothetical protein
MELGSISPRALELPENPLQDGLDRRVIVDISSDDGMLRDLFTTIDTD